MAAEYEQRLSWASIMGFVGPGTRPYIEGELILNSNHIICCGVKHREIINNRNLTHIFAMCLQSTKPSGLPHQLDIVLSAESDETSEINIESCKCSCVAGNLQHCKHVVATLMYINR